MSMNSILRVFDSTPKKTLNMSKLNANTLHKKIQRASLDEIMILNIFDRTPEKTLTMSKLNAKTYII